MIDNNLITKLTFFRSRKRRPSTSQDDSLHPTTAMDECSAALVLMSLSCSPQNGRFPLETKTFVTLIKSKLDKKQCTFPPELSELIEQYAKSYSYVRRGHTEVVFALSFLRYCSVFKEVFPLFARELCDVFFLASSTYRKVTSYGNNLRLFCFVVNIEITPVFVFRRSMEMRKRFLSLYASSNSADTKSSFMTFGKVISSCCLRENKLTLNAGS